MQHKLFFTTQKDDCTQLFFVCCPQTPCKDHWGSGLDAMKDALALEKHVYQSLLDLHSKADANNDPQV